MRVMAPSRLVETVFGAVGPSPSARARWDMASAPESSSRAMTSPPTRATGHPRVSAEMSVARTCWASIDVVAQRPCASGGSGAFRTA